MLMPWNENKLFHALFRVRNRIMNQNSQVIRLSLLWGNYIWQAANKNLTNKIVIATGIVLGSATTSYGYVSESHLNKTSIAPNQTLQSDSSVINKDLSTDVTKKIIAEKITIRQYKNFDDTTVNILSDSRNKLIQKLRTSRQINVSDSLAEVSDIRKKIRLSNDIKKPSIIAGVKDDFGQEWEQRRVQLSNSLKRNEAKSKQLLAQTDSSDTVGDTFGDVEKLRQELLIDPIIIETKTRVGAAASPGSSAGTPTAYGASHRQAYVGGGARFPFDEKRDRVDGSLSFGFGEGDALKSLGVEFNFNITSVGGGDTFDFGDSGSIGFKLHKNFGQGTAAAFGWSNPIRWGDSTKARANIYGVITQAIPLIPSGKRKLPLTVSVGVGSGAFRSKGAIAADDDTPNVFGSIGLQVLPQLSLISSWTGNRLNMGVSVAPAKNIPIVINAIFSDVTDNLNGGSGLTISAGAGFRF